MKKTVYIVAALLVLLLSTVLFTACEEEKCEHTYGEWSVVTQPTCGKAGKQTRICSKCEKPDSKSISATGAHTFGEWTVEAEPTCKDLGERSHTCTVCGQTAYEDMPRAGEHIYENGACKVCKEDEATVGLEYIAYDESTCGVKGIGTATDVKIVLPLTNNGKTVVAIEADAFEGNTTIEGIVLTPNVTKIGEGAFHGCTALTTVTMNLAAKSALKTIGTAAFADCTALTSINIPTTLTAIGDWAFSGCTLLKTVTMTNSTLETIGEGAFNACTALTSFKIPASVITLGARAFENCSQLARVEVETVKATSTAKPTSKLTTIGSGAFRGCRLLVEVKLGANSVLQTVAAKAFENCSALASITLPKSLKTIEPAAFVGCTALAAVTLEVEEAAAGEPATPCMWTLTNPADALDTVSLTVESASQAAIALKITYLNYLFTRA